MRVFERVKKAPYAVKNAAWPSKFVRSVATRKIKETARVMQHLSHVFTVRLFLNIAFACFAMRALIAAIAYVKSI